ncbi:cytochrome C oxidase subunit IV family protein [Mycobacterium sp.]|uniref:cytochrome C oxidase subunit IV family protein n=1 Tax=Mycobacterium sp. TaxID=1785 RepID=UPI0025EE2B15|nr:cytochrome C oxidase subunit IV family protein [Mycobacterium sp.]
MTEARRRVIVVWAALLLLTFVSFVVGIEQDASVASAAAIIIVGIALFKVRLIGIHFMDLRVAPIALRIVFELYSLVVFVTLAAIDIVAR